jgi:hypothetical protein
MSDAGEKAVAPDNVRRLADAVRDVKNAAADRGEVVVELREAQRTRLELLAAELKPVFDEVPAEIDSFDFAISSGLQPRLWIDAVSHVTMGRDRRTYRFLKDTRLGRVVLAESADMKPVADQVTRYVAERMVERQQLMDGGIEPLRTGGAEVPAMSPYAAERAKSPWPAILSGIGLVVAGGLIGLAITAALLWEKLAALNLSS